MISNIKYREIIDGDLGFIKSSWIKNQSLNYPYKKMNRNEFCKYYSIILDEKLKTKKIIIACMPDDQNYIYGYVCYSFFHEIKKTVTKKLVLDFSFIKQYSRNLKIFTGMLNHIFEKHLINQNDFKYYTHLSSDKGLDSIVKKYNLYYNNFIF